jgi:hypothetical protein
MNMRKKLLWIGMLTTLLVGVVFAMIPFFGSLNPPANAGEGLPNIDISKMHVGEFILHDVDDQHWQYSTRYMIVRKSKTEFFIYYMLRNSEGATMLPDLRWWRAGWPCTDFGPTTEEERITDSSIVKCHDPDTDTDDYRPDITWRVTGEAIDHYYDDMERIEKYTIQGKFLIIGMG